MPSPDIRRNQIRVNVTTNVVRANVRATGPKGDTGIQGPTGQGVPTGGTVGQVLAKNSSTNYDTSFKTLTKTDVGLSNVDNTSDLNKPVSTAQAAANTADRARANHTGTQLASTISDLSKSSVGLGSVDNTSDLNKPISTATQTALNTKGQVNTVVAGSNVTVDATDPKNPIVSATVGTSPDATTTTKGIIQLAGDLAGTAALPTVPELANKAPLASPALTGTPTTPTATPLTNNTQIASTAYVDQSNVAMGANYVLKAGDTMTGNLIVPAVRITDNTNGINTGSTANLLRLSGGTTNDGAVLLLGGSTNGGITNAGALRTGTTDILRWNPTGIAIGSSGQNATHSLTLQSNATGIAAYNTTDQTTNFERALISWVSNIFTIGVSRGGTANNRAVRLQSTGGNFDVTNISTGDGVYIFDTTTAGAANSTFVTVKGSMTQSSGTNVGVNIKPTFNQSGTAAYTALLINPTETATGSGAKMLLDAQVGGVSKFSVDNQGNTTPTTAQFTPLATQPYKQGMLYFDTTEDALTFYSNDANVMLNIGQETFMRVTNNTAGIINNGTPVYINGQLAGLPTVAVAGTANNTTAQVIGLATETLAIGATGYVALQGKVRNVDTSAFAAGATLYLATGGALTTTGLVNPTLAATIGTVLVSNATTGIIQLNIARPTAFTGQGATVDLGTVLSNQGFRTAGTAYPITTSGATAFSGLNNLSGRTTIGAGGLGSTPITRTVSGTIVSTSSYTNICNASAASFTVTLPLASSYSGQMLWFKKVDSTVNTVTIACVGSDTIDGVATFVLSTQYKYVEIISNGTVWYVKGNN